MTDPERTEGVDDAPIQRTTRPFRYDRESLIPAHKCGAPGGTRTPDPLIRSQMLYPLSYGRTVYAQLERLIVMEP